MDWTPPIWLRRIDFLREEVPWTHELSPDERFSLACELMAFALNSLRRQAEEDGCSVSELLFRYEQATARLRARAT